MMDLNKDLRDSAELVGAEGLTWPERAKLVRAGKDRAPVTDGVFPESKKVLAGSWIIEVASPERACEIAARISDAPGRDGEPLTMPIEERKSAPPQPRP